VRYEIQQLIKLLIVTFKTIRNILACQKFDDFHSPLNKAVLHKNEKNPLAIWSACIT